jgi:hypothetical protein
MIELIMFLSGWWYFSKLRKRIDDLETEVMFLRYRRNGNDTMDNG